MKRMTDFWKVILGGLLLVCGTAAYAIDNINAPQAHWIFDKVIAPGIAGVEQLAIDGQGRIIVRKRDTMFVLDSQGAQLATWACSDGVGQNGFGVNAAGKIVAWCGINLKVFDELGNVLAQPALPDGGTGDTSKQVVVNDDGSFAADPFSTSNGPRLWTFNAANGLLASVPIVAPSGGFISAFKGLLSIDGSHYLLYADLRNFVLNADGTSVEIKNGVLAAIPADYPTAVGFGLFLTAGNLVLDQQYRSIGSFNSAYGGNGGGNVATLGSDGSITIASGGGIARYKQVSRTFTANIDRRPNPVTILAGTRSSSGDAVIDVDYIVNDADSATVTTAALAFDSDGDTFSSARRIKSLVEGTAANLGSAIPTGVSKRITWDVNQDLGFSGFATVSVEVLANDNRALIDIPFVQIPAGIPNAGDPDLVISTWPMSESDLRPAWYWLIATSDSRITFTNGQVFGSATSGAFNGQLLTSDAGTTTQGQNFLCSLLNVRPATQTEINRAQAGTTPGVQSYAPLAQVGPYPAAVNEIGVDVASTGLWVVKLP